MMTDKNKWPEELAKMLKERAERDRKLVDLFRKERDKHRKAGVVLKILRLVNERSSMEFSGENPSLKDNEETMLWYANRIDEIDGEIIKTIKNYKANKGIKQR